MAAASAVPQVEAGEDEGTISIASFQNLATNNPDAFHWYDVRDPEEVESDGTFSKAVIMTVDEVEENVNELPTDKPIVFFCSTGARSGEAHDIAKMNRENLQAYFLDANVSFSQDGSAPKVTCHSMYVSKRVEYFASHGKAPKASAIRRKPQSQWFRASEIMYRPIMRRVSARIQGTDESAYHRLCN
ncbi:MAG: hypothetical protein GY703_05660 [Gammaproteobacteria bacterium]|nr:hypothetical protein [Gammaproteobacteria bacterium]